MDPATHLVDTTEFGSLAHFPGTHIEEAMSIPVCRLSD
jgi:hypothetical protein